MAIVPVTVTVRNQADSAPLDGVLVQAYTAGGVFDSEATSGTLVTGQADLNLNGEAGGVSYTLRFSLAGRRFISGAATSVSVTDPPSPNNNFGPFDSVLGPSAPLVTLNTVEADLTAIENVLIRVYNASDSFIAEGTTDGSGVLTLALSGAVSPGTTYFVRPILADTVFSPVQSIAVIDPITPPSLNSFNLVGVPVTLPSAVDPSFCRITGHLVDLSGVGLKEKNVRITPVRSYFEDSVSYHWTASPAVVNANVFVGSKIWTTNASGYVDMELPRDGNYKIHIDGAENPLSIVEPFAVPNLASASLADVLFPYVVSVVYTPATLTIDLTGGTSEETVSLAVTDQVGRAIPSSNLSDLLEFSSSSVDIATVEVDESSGGLVVCALAAGTSTISVSRKSSQVAPRVPSVAALSATLVVTVT